MSVRATPGASFGPASRPSNAGASAGIAIIQIVVLVSFPFLMQSPDGERALIALIIATLLITCVSQTPSFGIPLTLFYVAIVNGLRRWIIPVFGYSNTDPLILVTAVLVTLNFVSLLLRRQIPRDTTISRLLLWFIIATGVEAFNPLQGSLAVGFGGLLLVTVPILWFYLARTEVTPKMMEGLFKLAVVLSVLCTLYGLYQQFVGLLPSELEYIRITKYSQLLTSSTARVFSTFSGFAEYAKFIGFGAVVSFASVLKRNKLAIFIFIFLSGAAFLSSSRGVVVSIFGTCIVLWAIQGISLRSWWPRLVVAAIVGVGGLVWSLKQVQSDGGLKASHSATSELLGHQTELLNPFESKKSDAGNHVSLQISGVINGLTHPFGLGTGSTTLAAFRFGGAGASTEGDFGNAFLSLGLFGGCVFAGLVFNVYREAVQNWRYFRDFNSLCSVGILISMSGQWLIGGDYIIAMLVWITVAYVDRAAIERRRLLALATSPDDTVRRPRSRNRVISDAGGTARSVSVN